jgi:hypothetical protein
VPVLVTTRRHSVASWAGLIVSPIHVETLPQNIPNRARGGRLGR